MNIVNKKGFKSFQPLQLTILDQVTINIIQMLIIGAGKKFLFKGSFSICPQLQFDFV